MGEVVNINGEIFKPEDARISVFDHGFLFGDSIYEVITTHKGRLYAVAEHLDRLFQSAEGIQLTIPYPREKIVEEMEKTAKAAGNEETYLRLIITRGEGELHVDPTSCVKPNLIIIAREAPDYPEEHFTKGVEVILSSVRRNHPESVSPALKTGNYMNNVLAMAEAAKEGAYDALMLNVDGVLTECTISNFFFVVDGTLKTPALESGILKGVTRSTILQVAEENGIPFEEGRYDPDELLSAEEAFISSSTKPIFPVTTLDGKPVGNGVPGPITQRLMALLEKKLDELVDFK